MKRAYLLFLLLALACLLPAQNSPLTLTAPNGGEVWTIGSTYAITWTQTDLTGNISIALMGSHHGPGFVLISEAVPVTDGTFDWTIPENIQGGDHFKVSIRMEGQGPMVPQDISDEDFTIDGGTTPPPPPTLGTVLVTAPNGGEAWDPGTTYDITWTQTDMTGNVGIALWNYDPQHQGPPWVIIAEDIPVTDGTYSWAIPADQIGGSFYRISVYQYPEHAACIYDMSDSTFTISGDTTPPALGTILVTAPNGGEAWDPGSTYDITWTPTDMTGNVGIALWNYNNHHHHGPNYVIIAEDIPVTDGTYSWAIPADQLGGDHYRISIYQYQTPYGLIFDMSDSTFTITGETTPPPPDSLGTLVLTAPNGGEELTAGTTYDITWTQTDVTGNVNIALIGGNGHHHHGQGNALIAEAIPATDGTYSWAIPAEIASGDNYKIRIFAAGAPGMCASDLSDAAFTIVGTTPPPPDTTNVITVVTPNGGEQWIKGSVNDITWTAVDYTGTVNIMLMHNDRHHHPQGLMIAMEAPNTGTYSWTIPAELLIGDNYVIQVKLNGGMMDVSDAVFSIIDAPVFLKASPNPTQQGTVITFEMKNAAPVSVRVYNIKGQCVRNLVDQQVLNGGQSIRWDGNDQGGRKVSAGIYFAKVTSGTMTASKKIIILK